MTRLVLTTAILTVLLGSGVVATSDTVDVRPVCNAEELTLEAIGNDQLCWTAKDDLEIVLERDPIRNLLILTSPRWCGVDDMRIGTTNAPHVVSARLLRRPWGGELRIAVKAIIDVTACELAPVERTDTGYMYALRLPLNQTADRNAKLPRFNNTMEQLYPRLSGGFPENTMGLNSFLEELERMKVLTGTGNLPKNDREIIPNRFGLNEPLYGVLDELLRDTELTIHYDQTQELPRVVFDTALGVSVTKVFRLSYAEPAWVALILAQNGLVSDEKIQVYSKNAVSFETKSVPAGDGVTQSKGEIGVKELGTSTALPTRLKLSGFEAIPGSISTAPQNGLVVTASPSQMDVIAQVISELDKRPRKIELEVHICEVSQSALRELGITYPNQVFAEFSERAEGTVDLGQTNASGRFEALSLGDMFRSNPLQLGLTLNALVRRGDADILAQPTLSTLEGVQANYFAGDRVPYISRTSVDSAFRTIPGEVSFIDAGILLQFKPRLDFDNQITLEVRPVVSNVGQFIPIGQDILAPITTLRELDTTVRVGHCETFCLAGMITAEERITRQDVPLLSKLPIAGKLFRNTKKDKVSREIVVLVTPRIIE